MARRNPIGKIADRAVSSLRDPLGTAGKVVERAQEAAALGRHVAEQVRRSAAGAAGTVVGMATDAAAQRAGRKPSGAPRAASPANLRAVPDVNEPAHTPTAPTVPEPEAPEAEKADTPAAPTAKAPAAKVPATKVPVKKAPADKAAVKKAAAKSPAKQARSAEETAAPEKEPAKKSTKKAPARKSASKKQATKATAKTSTTKKGTAKTAASQEAPPKTAEQVANIEGTDVDTPAGTPGAGQGYNPDTAERDLDQPGTEGVVEESTAKETATKSDQLRKAADPNPE